MLGYTANRLVAANIKALPEWLALCRILAAYLLVIASLPARAADPQPYSVNLADTGNAKLQQILKDSSNLIGLNETAPVGSFALVARAREDEERLSTALRSQGYYKAAVKIKIANRALDDPGIFDTIDYSPTRPPVTVDIGIELGPQFKLGRIAITGTAPTQSLSWLGLKPQAPALAADVLAARDTLLERLRSEGYALATIAEPIARLSPETETVAITYSVNAGRLVDIGAISITGLQRVRKHFAQNQLQISPGDRFNPAAIEKARRDLLATGVFSSVRAKVAKKADNQRQLPIEFAVTERPLRSTSLAGAYSTDLGVSLGAFWQHHNVLGGAEQLNLTAGITQLGGNSTTGIGYKLALAFSKPDFLRRGQTFNASLGGLRQSLSAYQQESVIAEVGLSRKLNNEWSAGLGLALEQATVDQAGIRNDYTLLSLPTSLKYASIDNPLDPTKGSLAAFALIPYQSLGVTDVDPFAVIQVSGSTYLNLAEPGRSVLALRGLLGDIEGAGQFSLPPDKRYYAGGSATVRGYRYQSIGPQFADGNPQGGTAIATATVELRQRILNDYGIAAFADAGQVSPNDLLLSGAWRIGAGIGARYYTPFGPLRVDVAVPLTRQSNSGSFEVYIGLGQAF